MSMEKLVELSAAARASGMTYGQYMAARQCAAPPPRRHIPGYLRSHVKLCTVCGAPLGDVHGNQKYCADCKTAADAERKHTYDQKRRGK